MKILSSMKLFFAASFLINIVLLSTQASADLKQIKLYKEAFEGAKPKCIDCHTSDKPKKEDGEHESNAYGKAIMEKAKEPTVETYKEVGSIEDFGKK